MANTRKDNPNGNRTTAVSVPNKIARRIRMLRDELNDRPKTHIEKWLAALKGGK